MGIAHVHRHRLLQRAERQIEREGVRGPGERDLVPAEAGPAHVDRVAAGAGGHRQHARLGLDASPARRPAPP